VYEYQFVKVAAVWHGTILDTANYEATVDEYARGGWRLVQLLIYNPMLGLREHNLIFERPAGGGETAGALRTPSR